MSSHQEKSKETVMPVPDVTTISNTEDEEVVDLEAVARLAKAKLDQDLADVRARNEGIAWKKQEQVDRLRKKKEDEDMAEAQRKLDEAAKAAKRVPVQPLVSLVFLSSWGWKLTWLPGWASSPAQERDSGAVQMQGEWWKGFLEAES